MAEQKSPDDVRHEFDDVVNMTPKELEDWLKTDESQAVGWGGDGGESVGHESGRRIVALKRMRKDELDDDDLAHMRKVVGYVRRHMARAGLTRTRSTPGGGTPS